MTQTRARRRRAVVTTALLAGALSGTGASTVSAAPDPGGPPARVSESFTTPGQHVYVVPAGVTRVDVVAVGGEGGHGARRGGRGGKVTATLDVEPGQRLFAVVGTSARGTTPGANGGGDAGVSAELCRGTAGAGGGASDVRTTATGQPGSAASRVVVAGGGGGASAPGPTDGPTYGGHAGHGGGSSSLGGFGGAGGEGGAGGGGDERASFDGDDTTGGAGAVVGEAPARGCGGGGGGGFGGGGGGAAADPGSTTGGGGGGGGQLAPTSTPAGFAKRHEAPSVTFTTPGQAQQSGPLRVTTTFLSFRHSDQGNGAVPFTNCPVSCRWYDGDSSTARPGSRALGSGYAHTQAWGSASRVDWDFNGSFVASRPGAAAAPTRLGQPFLLSEFGHSNNPTRAGNPTQLALQTRVSVEPPAGPPVEFRLLGPESIGLDFLETDNTPPCDPSVQETSTPCDDAWFLAEGSLRTSTEVAGLTWRLEVLGWRNPDGTFAKRFVTEEETMSQRQIFARVTVDPRSTTSTLTVEDEDELRLTMTTTPVPQTGGTVTFTADGEPIEGCTDLPADVETGTVECTPDGLPAGPVELGGGFEGDIGYGDSTATPVEHRVRSRQDLGLDLPATLTYGDEVRLEPSSSAGLPVTVSASTPETCTVTAEGRLTTTGAGDCTVEARQAGDDDVAPARVERTVQVRPATLTVTADDVQRAVGALEPGLTATVSGFVGGDDSSVITGEPELSTTATPLSPRGRYPITVSVEEMSADDYVFTAREGTLTLERTATSTTVEVDPPRVGLHRITTLAATVATDADGPVPDGGRVVFRLAGRSGVVAVAPLRDGRAVVPALLAGGTHQVVATFEGSRETAPSSSRPVSTAVGCDRTLGGRVSGAVTVRSGVTCLLPGTRVSGSVHVARGASVSIDGAVVFGSVTAVSPDRVRVCGSTVTGSASVTSAGGFVLVGDPATGCAGNSFGRGITVDGNRAGLVVVGNRVGGPVVARSNRGSGPLPGQEAPVVRDNRR